MKIGIIGLPGSGKTTIFNCLTGSTVSLSTGVHAGPHGQDPNIRLVAVPDSRLQVLSSMYEPRRTINAQVQYVDVAGTIKAREGTEGAGMDELLRHLRPVDALLHVVRCFQWGGVPPDPSGDFNSLMEELVLADLVTVEKRLDRLTAENKKGRKYDPEEFSLLEKARGLLESGTPLRCDETIRGAPKLRGYSFLSAKPMIICLNFGDEDDKEGTGFTPPRDVPVVSIKGNLEMEILELSPEEQDAFRKEMGIDEPAMFRLIRESYRLLGLISFFTVGKDEVRAWTIKDGTTAVKAAGVIHSDMERGFIRAEVVKWDDLVSLGSYSACQKAGKVRLEGKDYLVRDGDVIHFRFNV